MPAASLLQVIASELLEMNGTKLLALSSAVSSEYTGWNLFSGDRAVDMARMVVISFSPAVVRR
jgi:hypothetical protein